MMRPFTPARLRVALAGLALVVAALSFGCCDCDELGTVESIEHVGTIAKVEKIEVVGTAEPQADHWVVIHDNGKAVGSPWTGCEPEIEGDVVAYLPRCLVVKSGQTIGFRNYSETDVDVFHFQTLDIPDPSFSLPSKSTQVFKVVSVSSTTPKLFDIKSTIDHGGPEMIVEP